MTITVGKLWHWIAHSRSLMFLFGAWLALIVVLMRARMKMQAELHSGSFVCAVKADTLYCNEHLPDTIKSIQRLR